MDYTIEQHFKNIHFIEQLSTVFSKVVLTSDAYALVNILADFISEQPQYGQLDKWVTLADVVVGIIEAVENNRQITTTQEQEQWIQLAVRLLDLRNEILQTFKVVVVIDDYDRLAEMITYMRTDMHLVIIPEYANLIQDHFFIIVIRTGAASSVSGRSLKADYVINYGRMLMSLRNAVKKDITGNYDHYYLANAMNYAAHLPKTSIVTGSSHSLLGLDTDYFGDRLVNLSLPSQDLYYSSLIARKVIDENPGIRQCIIGTSYWIFHADLSKSIYGEQKRIDWVYYPIFQDAHHYDHQDQNGKNSDLDESIEVGVFDIKMMKDVISHRFYASGKNYFSYGIKRDSRTARIGQPMHLLSEQEKALFGNNRAVQHNKMLKYEQTMEENVAILGNLLKYLEGKQVKVLIANFPTSKYYHCRLDQRFKRIYYRTIDQLKARYTFEFVDLQKKIIHDDHDYADMDHLSDEGAIKVSKFLEPYIT